MVLGQLWLLHLLTLVLALLPLARLALAFTLFLLGRDLVSLRCHKYVVVGPEFYEALFHGLDRFVRDLDFLLDLLLFNGAA